MMGEIKKNCACKVKPCELIDRGDPYNDSRDKENNEMMKDNMYTDVEKYSFEVKYLRIENRKCFG